ncbi:hypothetical protein [Nocardiopsis alba]|uniref:hypothetical protein n=1 Tax=Nocardiopsis alba TaxID=53437 RepID=UPI0035D5FFC7
MGTVSAQTSKFGGLRFSALLSSLFDLLALVCLCLLLGGGVKKCFDYFIIGGLLGFICRQIVYLPHMFSNGVDLVLNFPLREI